MRKDSVGERGRRAWSRHVGRCGAWRRIGAAVRAMVGVGAARRSWAAAVVVVLQAAWALVGGQVRYSVPEEA